MTRRESLSLIVSMLLLTACDRRSGDAVRVGSHLPNIPPVLPAVYAAALQRVGIPARQSAATDADIELVFATLPIHTPLVATPATVAPCLVTSQYAAEQFWLLTLEKCARIARHLRLAATPEFVTEGGALDTLRRRYGGFRFKEIIVAREGEQYDALGRGDADVANGSSIDGTIALEQFVILRDDRRTWPARHLVPVARPGLLMQNPRIEVAVNCTSAALTQYAVQGLTMRAEVQGLTARQVADDFVDRLRCTRANAVTTKRA